MTNATANLATGTLIVSNTGPYMVGCSVGFEGTSGEVWDFQLFESGNDTGIGVPRSTGNSDVGAASAAGPVWLTNGAPVDLRFKADSTDVSDPVFKKCQLWLHEL